MQKTIKLHTLLAGVALMLVGLMVVAVLSSVSAQDETEETTDKTLKSAQARCVGAQSKVRALQQQTTDAGNKRNKLYAQIDGRMQVAVGKLKLGDKDVTDLEKARVDFVAKTAKFTELNQTYVQSLGEVALAGCRDDPAAFLAALTTARQHNTEIRALNTEIRTTVNDEIKPAISAFTGTGDAEDSGDTSSDETSEE